jgi:hypothetical protein
MLHGTHTAACIGTVLNITACQVCSFTYSGARYTNRGVLCVQSHNKRDANTYAHKRLLM